MTDRYSRQIMLPEIGGQGQRRLMESSVLIVGLGGLGCPVALYLAGAGVGRIGLADADVVSLSNLHRQLLYDEASVGCPKVEAARRRLQAVSSAARFDLLPDGFTGADAATVAAGYDLIVDCCDNYSTRYLIDDVCAALAKPWVFGSISGFRGMVSTFAADARVRYADLFPDRAELEAEPPASGGVIGPTPGVIGSIQAAEAIRLLAGGQPALAGKLLTADLLTMQFNLLDL